jgi:hypothetical protein
MMRWSGHSPRMDPITRSTSPFCQGDVGVIGSSRIPIARTRRGNTWSKALSVSRIGNCWRGVPWKGFGASASQPLSRSVPRYGDPNNLPSRQPQDKHPKAGGTINRSMAARLVMCFWRKAFQPRDHARGGLIMDRETVDSGAAFSRRRCVRRIRYGELWRRATRPDTQSYRPLPIFYPLITHTSSTRVTDARRTFGNGRARPALWRNPMR